MLELYHAGLSQASVKVRTTLKEKGLSYTSHHLRVPEGEHLSPAYLAINPDGQVPALVHDGNVIVETSVINEYLDDAFRIRRCGPRARSSARACGAGARSSTSICFTLSRRSAGTSASVRSCANTAVPSSRRLCKADHPSKRQKWFKAYQGFRRRRSTSPRNGHLRGGAHGARAGGHPYLAGPTFSLADINVLSSVERMPRWAPDLMSETVSPRSWEWLQRMMERPAVKATYSVSDEAPPRSTEVEAAQAASQRA